MVNIGDKLPIASLLPLRIALMHAVVKTIGKTMLDIDGGRLRVEHSEHMRPNTKGIFQVNCLHLKSGSLGEHVEKDGEGQAIAHRLHFTKLGIDDIV